MEKCSVCFQAVETDILVPPDECVKLINNFLVSLHSSIAEKNEIPFVSGGQFSFCEMCFEAAFQLNQVNEQLSAFQKQLSDLTVEFSLSVLYRRSQTTTPTVGNKSVEQIVEINVSGLPHELFSFNNSKNPCEHEKKNIDDVIPTIITGNANEVDIVTPDYHEIGNDINDSALLEYSAETENQDLFIFPNQNPVETENIKLELNYDSICISNVITKTDSNTLLFSCPSETDDSANCFIDNKIEQQKQNDNSTIDLDEVEYENDPLCLTRHKSREVDKSFEIKRQSSKPENNELKTKSQLLTFDRTPSIILKRVQLDQIGVATAGRQKLLNPKVEKNITTSCTNISLGRTEETYTMFKHRKRAKKVMNSGPFPCEFCNKVFKAFSRMKEHKRTHTGERPFQCPFCSKAFKQMGHLTGHQKTHTGERPYKCYYCAQNFPTISRRRLHQLSHHGGTRYNCNRCLKRFNAESTWQKHLPFCRPKEHE